MTPRARTAGSSWLTKLNAPRSLKAPPACRFSHFSHKCAHASSLDAGISGVTRAASAMRCRARWMASSSTSGNHELGTSHVRPRHSGTRHSAPGTARRTEHPAPGRRQSFCPFRHSSSSRGMLPLTDRRLGVHPSARARGLRTT